MSTKRGKSKRARNGQGSIYETTFVDKRSGKTIKRWQAQVVVPQELGAPKRKTLYGKSYAEVKEKMDALMRQIADGTLSNIDETVAQYLRRWLEEIEHRLEARSIEDYQYAQYAVEHYIIPRIDKVKLAKLTPMQVQTMVSDIANKSGVRTANKCRARLFTALKQAVRWQLIPRNPVEVVDALKERPRQQTIWDKNETLRFLDAAQTHWLYALFYLAIATGLRKSELIHLRWDDIEGTTLTVRKSKTPKGVRRVALSPGVLEVLEEHRARQKAEQDYLGELWAGLSLVFPSEIGTKICPRNLTRTSHMLLRKVEVRHATIHDLRHLNVSIRRKLGQDAKLIADQIGHTDAGFTTRLYTHIFEDDRENSAVDLSKALSSHKPSDDED